MDVASAFGGGVAGTVAAARESELDIQSQLARGRLARADQKRATALSRLHTLLDRTLEFNDRYIGSHDAGHPEARLQALRRAAVRSWARFDRAFARAEILPSGRALAEKIRIYGHAIAQVRGQYESARSNTCKGAACR